MILKGYNKLIGLFFLTKSSVKAILLPKILGSQNGSLKIRGANADDINNIENIYQKLNSQSLSKYRQIQFKLHSEKTIIVAEQYADGINKLVGMNMYYLNHRDFNDGTIHEGFIGVLPEFEGKGIATQMRKRAKEHFKNVGFKGISSRISKNNIGSINSAKKLGFEPVEEYFDTVMNESRYYLICNLKEEK